MDSQIIAPCGMNCALCLANLREKKKCLGCNSDEGYKAESRNKCIIKNCPVIKENESGFCYECEKFPCQRLKQLDKRYRLKYNMSMLENLMHIKDWGMDSFLTSQKNKYRCENCGGFICVHRGYCLKCNPKPVKNKGIKKE